MDKMDFSGKQSLLLASKLFKLYAWSIIGIMLVSVIIGLADMGRAVIRTEGLLQLFLPFFATFMVLGVPFIFGGVVLASSVTLLAGSLCKKHCNNPGKAWLLILYGVFNQVIMVLTLFAVMLFDYVVYGGILDGSVALILLIFSFVITVLLIVGAAKNRLYKPPGGDSQ